MGNKPLIVCVDDDPAVLATVRRCLTREGAWEVRASTDIDEILRWIDQDPVSVLVADYEMPQMTGARLAARTKQIRPETVRILLTGVRSLDAAIEGINQGEVFRFIQKPFEDQALRGVVRDAVRQNEELLALSGDRQLRERRRMLRDALEQEYPGISTVDKSDGCIEVTADPWRAAHAIGLGEIVDALGSSSS